ncbi:MAG: gliding motility-associated C-terminal domain-containing protein [Bacteroidia bacterium]
MKKFSSSSLFNVLIAGFSGICLSDSFAQNLIPNGGFENFTACPNFASQLNLAAPWSNPNAGTPEYFNSCADLNSWVSVPAQPSGGYQNAHAGEAYAGVFTYRFDVQNMREYLQVPLNSVLEAGECYYFEMFVNMPNDHRYACDRVGAYASVGPLSSAGVSNFNIEPHIENPAGAILSDTSGWLRINGYFSAEGGEDHLTIGNFRPDDQCQTALVNPTSWYTTSSYLLIDDVSLVKASFQSTLEDQSYCNINQVTLDVSEAEANYLWQDGSVLPTYRVNKSGLYEVTISRGSCVNVLSANISMLQTPSPVLTDSTICLGYDLKLEVRDSDGQFLWSSGSNDRTLSVSEEGLYWVEVTNVCGVGRDSMQLSTFDCGCEVFLPSAFTPNQDAVNDDFYIAVDCPKMVDFSFFVFSRGGELIFQSKDPYQRWDGTSSGRDCPSGVYTYTLSYFSLAEGQMIQQDYSGSIRLVR